MLLTSSGNKADIRSAHWQCLQLGDICKITTGKKDVDEGSPDGIYPFFSCAQKISRSDTYSFDTEAILIAGNGDVGNTKYYQGKFEAYQRTYVLYDFIHYTPYIYFYLLAQIKTELLKKKSGSTMPYIRKGDLSTFPIYIPPLPEQRAIAHVLQTVQNAIQARRKELELERERKAALMQHLFTHGTHIDASPSKEIRFGNIPSHWDIQLLDQCAIVQTGLAKGRKLEDNHIVTLPYLRVANVQDGYLDLTEIKTIELRSTEVERYKLYPGDVLVTEGGDFDKLGRGFLWNGEIPECVHQNHIFAIRAHKDVLLPEYLAYLIQSNYGKAYFLSVAHKTTNLACINSSKLKAFPTLLPSLDEQQEIATILQACDSKIAALEKEIALQEELFRALLDELMTGKLSTLPLVE